MRHILAAGAALLALAAASVVGAKDKPRVPPELRSQAAAGSKLYFQTASARLTHGKTLGLWSLDLYQVNRLWAVSNQQFPTGVIQVASNSVLAVDMDDVKGAQMYISCAGLGAGRNVNVWFTHRIEGGQQIDSKQAGVWEATEQRYYALGPKSDGSLKASGRRSRIQLFLTDQRNWEMSNCRIGWLK